MDSKTSFRADGSNDMKDRSLLLVLLKPYIMPHSPKLPDGVKLLRQDRSRLYNKEYNLVRLGRVPTNITESHACP